MVLGRILKKGMDKMSLKNNKEKLIFNKDFQDAYDLLENSKEQIIYITGEAGTGKSTLLRHFREKTKKQLIVLAPTGVAALNVEAKTIHSFFWFPHKFIQQHDIKKHQKISKLLGCADAVVIDEVSMVRADLMDAIDYSMRLNLGKMNLPFGGKRVILFGDMYQLPPVVENSLVSAFSEVYPSPYFFDAKVFNSISAVYFELTSIYRQKDPSFIQLLNKIRNGILGVEDLAVLNQRVTSVMIEDSNNPVVLTSTNAIADRINEDKLEALKSEEYYYEAEISGSFRHDKKYPVEFDLKLKEGAQVMLVRNDPAGRWVNGTMGKIKRLLDQAIEVTIGSSTYKVKEVVWEEIDYTYDPSTKRIETEVTGTFKQYPLKLAWAITIHKSQGKTFDNMVLTLGNGAFAHGQVYVALSRCRTLEGISLIGSIRHEDLIFDEQAVQYKSKFKKV